MIVDQQLHPVQLACLQSQSPFRLFCAGRGSGKTLLGATDMILRLRPGREYGVMAPDYTMLNDVDLPELIRACERLHFGYTLHRGAMSLSCRQALIHLRSLDNPEKIRGHSWAGAWIDEGSIVRREAYDIVLGCMRSEGEQGWVLVTFTPKGKTHWTFEISKHPDVAFFHASSTKNPFLPPTYVAHLRSQYGSLFAQQEIDGQFIDFTGGLFRREWFRVLPEAPANVKLVTRYWDLAATPKTKTAEDPDWTCGVKLGFAEGVWYILDVIRFRASAMTVEQRVQQSAVLDSARVRIRMEEEAGASGKSLISVYARLLPGYDFKGHRPSGDKWVRAIPLAAAAEAGNVVIIAAPWNEAFLSEAEDFSPTCAHDDQVDAASGAMDDLRPCVGASQFAFLSTPTIYDQAVKELDDDIRKEYDSIFDPAERLAAAEILRKEGYNV